MARGTVKTRLICPLTSRSLRQMRHDMRLAAERGADAIELRIDYLTRLPSAEQIKDLLADAPLEPIVTLRPVRQGGHYSGQEARRLEFLAQAAACERAMVDLEMDSPWQDWPAGRVILSHHAFERVPRDLDEIVSRLEASPAAVNKVAFTAAGPEDALRALDVIRACGKPTIALAMGEAGVASRILAKKLGAFGTFAALEAGAESAPGQVTLQEMKALYRWDAVDADTMVCGVIGCPIAHSMSPAVHNAAFAASALNAVYVPLRIEPGADNFNRFMDALLDRPWLNWRGLSVTIPHKENALAYVGADNCEELARSIGAVNTITIDPAGRLQGHNSDYAAALDALCEAIGIDRAGLAGRSVAVLGAGGAARAIVAGLCHCRADVCLYNRTVRRAQKLAEEFSCSAKGLDALESMEAEIVVNCTPIGMHPNVDASPLGRINPSVKVVFDTIYNPLRTLLLRQAAEAKVKTVSGLEMFVNQAAAQFELWTHRPAPRQVMSQAVARRLSR